MLKLFCRTKRHFSLFLLLSCVFIFWILLVNNTVHKNSNQLILGDQLITVFKEHISNNTENRNEEAVLCEPFLHNIKQYQVEIDDELYPKRVLLEYNNSINFECLNKAKQKPLILFWNDYFGDKHYKFKNFEDRGCPVSNCETTIDKYRYNESSLVITHMRSRFELDHFPKYRPNNLRTVFFLYESPMNSGDYSKFQDFFNLTATYRLETDFPLTLNAMVWKENTDFNADYDFHGSKKGFAAALISNCGDSSGRLKYIKELKKYVEVDVYGNCGDMKCPSAFRNGTKTNNCRAILAEKYKFYLAFENSLCTDYITEKFFWTIMMNTVPVVLGNGQYDQYVSINTFTNPKAILPIQETFYQSDNF
jgi:alpha-1,3-fucosyltransferase